MLWRCLSRNIWSNRWPASTKPSSVPNHISSSSQQPLPSRQTNPHSPPLSNLKHLCMFNGRTRLMEAILEMGIQGLRVSFNDYDFLLRECIKQKAIREGQRVHAHMIKTRYLAPVFLNTRLIIMYSKLGFLEDARQMFDGMSERNVVSWTAMISGYAQRVRRYEALDLFLRMLESGLPPNEFTFASTLTTCTGPCGLDHGRQVHSLVIKSNFESHIFVSSSLLDMYAKAGQIHEAREIFNRLPERNVVSCTAIISAYAHLGFDDEALELFRQLQKEGMEANHVTYVSVLTALSGLVALDYGQQVHNQMIRYQVPSNVILQNSLIDMYSKCGSLTYSRRVFDRMSERTVISWNSMLLGYCKHGLGRQVLELFKLMQGEDLRPDRITFMAVLSGCSHGGLVDEGLEIFYSMVQGHYVEPEIEHYGCVVDLLGRAGQVDKALTLIKQMPFEPTAGIWGTLLGACRAYANIPVGEYVARQLFDIEPQNARTYVILSNIFAAVGRWEDVINVRQLMKEKTVTKEPGQSWIKLDRTFHAFHVDDQFHLKKGRSISEYNGTVGTDEASWLCSSYELCS